MTSTQSSGSNEEMTATNSNAMSKAKKTKS